MSAHLLLLSYSPEQPCQMKQACLPATKTQETIKWICISTVSLCKPVDGAFARREKESWTPSSCMLDTGNTQNRSTYTHTKQELSQTQEWDDRKNHHEAGEKQYNALSHLSKQLLEVVVGLLGHLGHGSKGGIIAHRSQGFSSSLHHGQQLHLQGFLGVPKGLQGLQDAVSAHHLAQPQLVTLLTSTLTAATTLCNKTDQTTVSRLVPQGKAFLMHGTLLRGCRICLVASSRLGSADCQQAGVRRVMLQTIPLLCPVLVLMCSSSLSSLALLGWLLATLHSASNYRDHMCRDHRLVW